MAHALSRANVEVGGDSSMMSSRMHSTQMAQTPQDLDFSVALSVDSMVESASPEPSEVSAKDGEFGEYWLPWHIDSNFLTLIHKDMYIYEKDATRAPHPEGAG